MQVFCFSFVKCLCSGDALARLVLVLSRFFRVDIRRVLRVRTKSTGLALGHAWGDYLGAARHHLEHMYKIWLVVGRGISVLCEPPHCVVERPRNAERWIGDGIFGLLR